MVRKISLFLLTITAIVSVLITNSQAQSVLTRHVREATRTGEAKPIGQLPSDQIMNLDVVLPLRDQADWIRFSRKSTINQLSYRHFVTVPEFTQRFGPTQADYDAVVSFLKANGFAVVGGTRDGMDVQIKGPVSAIETAFHVTMRTYQHPTESPYLLPRRPRAGYRLVDPALAYLGSGQLLHSTSHVGEEVRLCGCPWYRCEGRRLPCHYRLRPVGFVFGQRHARGLLWRNSPDRRRPEPRIVRVFGHRPGRLDHLF